MDNLADVLSKLKSIENKFLENHFDDEQHYDLLISAGVSQYEFLLLKKSYKDYLLKGQHNLKMNLPSDALADFRTAHLISPYEFDVNIGLALTYTLLWEYSASEKEKMLALKFAARSQELEPELESVSEVIKYIINTIQNNKTTNGFHKKILQYFKKEQNSFLKNVLIFIGAIFVIICFVYDYNVQYQHQLKFSNELQKKYEQINLLIENKNFEKAEKEIKNLVHQSSYDSPYFPPDVWDTEHYSFKEYWDLKRKELQKKIDSVKTSLNR